MRAEMIRHAIMATPRVDLPKIAGTVWKAHAAGLVDDNQAQDLAELIEARKVVPIERPAVRRVGSRPKSTASLERRRRWVSAGMMPPSIACQFTMGECAVLAVVAAEVQKHGRCVLVLGAIAAIAGVSISTAKNAIREARRLGLVTVEERRLSWNRSLSNVVRVVSSEWSSWLRLGGRRGGGKSVPATNTKIHRKPFAPFGLASRKMGSRKPGAGAGGSTRWHSRHRP